MGSVICLRCGARNHGNKHGSPCACCGALIYRAVPAVRKPKYDKKLDQAIDAYLESVQQPHSDEYWDKVNQSIADEQRKNMELNKRFIPSEELMRTRFDV